MSTPPAARRRLHGQAVSSSHDPRSRFDAIASVTVCPLTTNPVVAPLTRIEVEPSPLNGFDPPSRLMVDKLMTMPRATSESMSLGCQRLPRYHSIVR